MLPFFVRTGKLCMHVPDSARRCVVFIGEIDTQGAFKPRATAFLAYTADKGSQNHHSYLVTAQHVVTGLTERGQDVAIRFNLLDGSARVQQLTGSWWFHPDPIKLTDVALMPIGLNWEMVDHECVPLIDETERTPNAVEDRARGLGLGDETFTIGLFRTHQGKQRNIPIVRIGNIAAMPEEPIPSEYCGYIDGYLVEMRSIAGLSGSPVFARRESARPIGTYLIDPRFKLDHERVYWSQYHFVGLVHGHFGIKSLLDDSVTDQSSAKMLLDTGIGVVIPAAKILETIYQPDLVAERKQAEDAIARQSAVIPDSGIITSGSE